MKKRKFVCMMFIFFTVQLLEDTPAVVSLGKLCKEHGCTHEWPSGGEPRLTKHGNQTFCRTENFVPPAVPGLSSSSATTSSSTSLFAGSIYFIGASKYAKSKELRETATGNVFPNGWRTSQRTSRSQKYFRPQTLFSRFRFGTSCKNGITEAQYFYSLLTRPTLRGLLANHDDKVSLQKANGKFSTSSTDVW